MTRRAALTGLVLCLMGLAVFLYKAAVLDVPVLPSDPANLWQVEMTISVRGDGERGSVRALLPSSSAEQVIFDQTSSSDRLSFETRDQAGQRVGVWSGRFENVHRLMYGFRVKLTGREKKASAEEAELTREELRLRFGQPEVAYPTRATEVLETIERLGLSEPRDVMGRVRAVHAYVLEEVALVDTASSDALLALAQREADETGKARLAVTLLRAAEVPARLVRGLRLREGAQPRPEVWTEAWTGEAWVSLSPTGEFFGERPRELLRVHSGEASPVEATGVTAFGYQVHARRERLRPEELAAMMMPTSKILAAVSLYRVPLSVQDNLRLLLLMPLGALFIAIFRNLIGLSTVGTFMPVLIALALRTSGLVDGILLLGGVVAITVAARVLLNKLRLLVVPRLGVLLCLVVLCMTALSLVGSELQVAEMFASILFPVVILTMFVERFSLKMSEEGPRSALMGAGTTMLAAVLMYPVFRNDLAAHLMFGFPELVFTIMGLLTFLGGYTGYRLMDLKRFKSLTQG